MKFSPKKLLAFGILAALSLIYFSFYPPEQTSTRVDRQGAINMDESIKSKQRATGVQVPFKFEYSPVIIAELKKELDDKIALSEEFEVTEEVSSLLK